MSQLFRLPLKFSCCYLCFPFCCLFNIKIYILIHMLSVCLSSICPWDHGWSAGHHSNKLCKSEKWVRCISLTHLENHEWEPLSPSKSTRPSPFRSTSCRISLISLLVTCSPISFFIASRSSVKLIWPSPLESNWTGRHWDVKCITV